MANTASLTKSYFDASYSPTTVCFGHKWTIKNLRQLRDAEQSEEMQNKLAHLLLATPTFGHKDQQTQLDMNIRIRLNEKNHFHFDSILLSDSCQLPAQLPVVVKCAKIDQEGKAHFLRRNANRKG